MRANPTRLTPAPRQRRVAALDPAGAESVAAAPARLAALPPYFRWLREEHQIDFRELGGHPGRLSLPAISALYRWAVALANYLCVTTS
jgi:hypothetical protein